MTRAGIVRRIDELGRIVIPKEIRKKLRIREADPIEIFTENEGEIILKKYSPMGDEMELAENIAKSLAENTGCTICITDRETIVSASGKKSSFFENKGLSEELIQVMEDRESICAAHDKEGYVSNITDSGDEDACAFEIVSPIISEGDVCGCVIMISMDEHIKPTETQKQMTKMTADLLGMQMEG